MKPAWFWNATGRGTESLWVCWRWQTLDNKARSPEGQLACIDQTLYPRLCPPHLDPVSPAGWWITQSSHRGSHTVSVQWTKWMKMLPVQTFFKFLISRIFKPCPHPLLTGELLCLMHQKWRLNCPENHGRSTCLVASEGPHRATTILCFSRTPALRATVLLRGLPRPLWPPASYILTPSLRA